MYLWEQHLPGHKILPTLLVPPAPLSAFQDLHFPKGYMRRSSTSKCADHLKKQLQSTCSVHLGEDTSVKEVDVSPYLLSDGKGEYYRLSAKGSQLLFSFELPQTVALC